MCMEDGMVINTFCFKHCIAYRWDSGCYLIINMLSTPSVAIEAVLSKSNSMLSATLHYRYRTLTCHLMSWGTRLQRVECSALPLLLPPKLLYFVLPSQCGTERTPSASIVSGLPLQSSCKYVYVPCTVSSRSPSLLGISSDLSSHRC